MNASIVVVIPTAEASATRSTFLGTLEYPTDRPEEVDHGSNSWTDISIWFG